MKLRKPPPQAEIPTASMADMAFLLIVFFVITGVFAATKGLDFKLPRQQRQESAAAAGEDPVFIKVNADSTILVDCKPMGPAALLDYLEPKLVRHPDRPVILYTDPDAPYQAMIDVYDAIGSSEATRGFGIKNLSVPTATDVVEYTQLYGMNPFEADCAS